MSQKSNYDPFAVPEGYNPSGTGGEYNSAPPAPNVQKPLSKAFSNLIALALAVVAMVLLVYVPRALFPPKADKNPSVGSSFPVFKIEAIGENPDQLDFTSYQLVGKITLIHLWGPWNPICSNEAAPLNEVVKQLSKDPKFQYVSVVYPSEQVLGIESSLDDTGEKTRILKVVPQSAPEKKILRAQTSVFLDQRKIPKTNLYWDPVGSMAQAVYYTQQTGSQQQFFSFPTVILVDQDKTIRAVWLGYTPGVEKQILNAGKALL